MFKVIEIIDGNETVIATEMPDQAFALKFIALIDMSNKRNLQAVEYGVVQHIHTAEDLAAFAETYKLREDWHEPDEQGVTARVVGSKLDNAFGATTSRQNHDGGGELNVILSMHGIDAAVINLADLLAWASTRG